MADKETLDLRVRMSKQGSGALVLSIAEGEALVKLLDAIEAHGFTYSTGTIHKALERFYAAQGGG